MNTYTKTLYTKDSKGKTRVWTISTTYDLSDLVSPVTITIQHGVQGSDKIQTKERVVKKGKNIGKANETTVHQQALLEIDSLITSQLDKGYVHNIEDYRELVQPMLAHKYSDRKNSVTWDTVTYYSSRKFDGIRCFVFVLFDGSIKYVSRTGKSFKDMTHITEELMSCPFYLNQTFTDSDEPLFVLDGELYSEELEFPDISSRVNSESYDADRDTQIHFYMYDFINFKDVTEAFPERMMTFVEQHQDRRYIHIVEQTMTGSEEQMLNLFNQYISEGYEGLMLKSSAPYVFGKRSVSLLKYKEMLTDEFKILSISLAENDPTKVQITFHVDGVDTKEFTVGTVKGAKEDVYKSYYECRDDLIGKWCTVQYQTLSPYGVPLFPVCIGVREGDEINGKFIPSV